jgi:hypothetical protein
MATLAHRYKESKSRVGMGRIPKMEKPGRLMLPSGNNSVQSTKHNQFTGMVVHEYKKILSSGM